MAGPLARPLFDKFVGLLKEKFRALGRVDEGELENLVQTGVFGQYMQVEIVNDGPVTIVLDS